MTLERNSRPAASLTWNLAITFRIGTRSCLVQWRKPLWRRSEVDGLDFVRRADFKKGLEWVVPTSVLQDGLATSDAPKLTSHARCANGHERETMSSDGILEEARADINVQFCG